MLPQSDIPPVRFAVLSPVLHAAGVLGLSLAFLAGGPGLSSTPAGAQGFFNNWGDPPAKPRKKAKRQPEDVEALTAKTSKKGEAAERAVTGPLVINVSLSRQ